MKLLIYLLVFAALSITSPAGAKEVSVLFIGNSLTYLPGLGTEKDPALPRLMQNIATSIDSNLKLRSSYSTHGGFTLEKHLADGDAVKLMEGNYDKVILQGYSIESLMLPPWWDPQRIGEKFFADSLGKILKKVATKNQNITLYVPWGLNPQNSLLQERHPGLRFPPGTVNVGKKWCGDNKYEYQNKINEGYKRNTQGYTVKFSYVGSVWLELQDAGLVTQDELYIPGDWKHASSLGGFITALVLVRDVLQLDISKNKFVPPGISAERAHKIQVKLSKIIQARSALAL